jgi:hypothetical protein
MSLEEFSFSEEHDEGGAENREQQQEAAREQSAQAKKQWQQTQKKEQKAKEEDVNLSVFLVQFLQKGYDTELVHIIIELLSHNMSAQVLIAFLFLNYQDELQDLLSEEVYALFKTDNALIPVESDQLQKEFHSEHLPKEFKLRIQNWLSDIVTIARDIDEEKLPFVFQGKINPYLTKLFELLVQKELQHYKIDIQSKKHKEDIHTFCLFLLKKLISTLR